VRSVGVLPALVLLAGTAYGVHTDPHPLLAWALIPLVCAAWGAWSAGRVSSTAALLAAGFFCAGSVVAADARFQATHPALREVLDRQFGGFLLGTPGAGGRPSPVLVRATLAEDGAEGGDAATLRAAVSELRLKDEWHPAAGGVVLTVGGSPLLRGVTDWRAGRTIEAPVTFRRPARYLDEGVPDFERDLALDGTALFGSIKSGLLVSVGRRGSVVQELAARIRARVRRSIEKWVRPHDAVAAAIVTAVLIGDRTGVPESVRLRLQAAGTYHVIAISGGNIAILAALALTALLLFGVTGRLAAVITVILLIAYAGIVTSSASVWRATLMAVLYLSARLLDHRSPPWHAVAVAAALVLATRPLDVRDAGFLLTFGATVALIEVARRATQLETKRRAARWVVGSLAASAATEIALLPVSAWAFSRVTIAGLLLNLVAVPVMGLVQVGGLLVCVGVDLVAQPAGWIACLAARALVESARLVDVASWLAVRVPPPPPWILAMYYAGLAGAIVMRGAARALSLTAVLVAGAAIVSGHPVPSTPNLLRLTVFDVGQGDAALVQFPNRSTLLVDAGGLPYGSGGFNIGSRVLAPALWARGVRRLDTVLLTHGDPDHIGGARAALDDFGPAQVWQGIPVATHIPLRELLEHARVLGIRVERQEAGNAVDAGEVHVRILHPPPPDWERQRVRNDDSVVLELTYRNVATLLLGDVGADVERAVLPHLSHAAVRILKVAHHGSRTSTSQELLTAWQPQIAIISCGRGNTFGHPAPEVIERLKSSGATIYRTDLDGEITLDTDGHTVQTKTYVGEKR
jgi:competence protein ComEC